MVSRARIGAASAWQNGIQLIWFVQTNPWLLLEKPLAAHVHLMIVHIHMYMCILLKSGTNIQLRRIGVVKHDSSCASVKVWKAGPCNVGAVISATVSSRISVSKHVCDRKHCYRHYSSRCSICRTEVLNVVMMMMMTRSHACNMTPGPSGDN